MIVTHLKLHIDCGMSWNISCEASMYVVKDCMSVFQGQHAGGAGRFAITQLQVFLVSTSSLRCFCECFPYICISFSYITVTCK